MSDCKRKSCCGLYGVLSPVGVLEGELSLPEQREAPTYEGPYTVIPTTQDQKLPTNQKLMNDDVTVTEIPYAETGNPYGTTVSIAS